MRCSYSPDGLRLLSKEHGPQWEGQARAALSYAADVIECAEQVINEKSAKPAPIMRTHINGTVDVVGYTEAL